MRLSQRTAAAAKLYTEGRYADAAAALESICHESVGYPRTHALAVQNLGAVSLALGEVERGRELMRAAARSGWFETFTLRLVQGPAILQGGLAIAARMADDSDATRRHLEIARARCRRGKEGLLSYPEAYCELRDGRYADVAHAHPRRLGALAGRFRLLEEVPLTIRYAFALEQLGRAEEATATLQDVAELERDGRHRGLGARWPEMTAFLERHRLVPGVAASPSSYEHDSSGVREE